MAMRALHIDQDAIDDHGRIRMVILQPGQDGFSFRDIHIESFAPAPPGQLADRCTIHHIRWLPAGPNTDVCSMQQSQRPLVKPATKPVVKPTTAAKPPAPNLPELDLGEEPAQLAAPVATTAVTTTTTVSKADEAAIDAQLEAMATHTTVEDLARRGKKNLKTLSERQLKEWIREALRRVISTTSTVSDADQERMLAATRAELGALMSEAGSGNAEREALEAQVTQLKSDRRTLASERDNLIIRLAEMERRLDDAAGLLADAESNAAVAAEPDIEEIESLRSELGQIYSRLSASENERAGLQKTLGARLVASSEVAAGVLELDQTCYGGLHLQVAQSDAAGDEAAFYADEVAARATAGDLVRDLSALRSGLAEAAPGIDDQGLAGDQLRLAELRAKAAHAGMASSVEMAAVVRERDEARQQAESAKRALARLIAQGEQKTDQQTTARITRAESETRQAAGRLAQIESDLATTQRRMAEAEAGRSSATSEAEALREHLTQAREMQRAAAGRAESLSSEVARLTRDLATARAGSAGAAAVSAECDRLAAAARAADDRTSAAAAALSVAHERLAHAEASRRTAELALNELRTAEQAAPLPAAEPILAAAPIEAVPSRLSHQDGAWCWNWPVADSVRTTTFRGAWSSGRTLAVASCDLLHLPTGTSAAWRSSDGHAHVAMEGASVHDLGDTPAAPSLSRGAGSNPPFASLLTPAGAVLVTDGDGLSEDLSSRLGCPPAAGATCTWWWNQEDSRHIAYRDAHGNINELLELDGTWYHASLTAHTGCPPASSDPVGYAPADHEHVIFRSTDGHIHELCFHGERWLDHDLTELARAPIAVGQPSGAYIGGLHHVAFRSADGGLHLIRLAGDWRHTALPRLGRSDADPILASSGAEGALAWLSGGRWSWARLGGDPANASAEPLPG